MIARFIAAALYSVALLFGIASAAAQSPAGDFIAQADLAWHLEVLAPTPEEAAAIEAEAARTNEAAERVRATLEDITAWTTSLNRGMGRRMLTSLLPGDFTGDAFYLEWYDARAAERESMWSIEHEHFARLAARLPDRADALDMLREAHSCARWKDQDGSFPQPVLREIARGVLGDDSPPEALASVLGAHERTLAALLHEQDRADAASPHARRRAWANDDMDGYVDAQMRCRGAEIEAFAEIGRAAGMVAAVLPPEQSSLFVTHFRRAQMPPMYSGFLERIESLIGRSDVGDDTRAAAMDIRERLFALMDSQMEERLTWRSKWRDIEWQRLQTERMAMRVFFGPEVVAEDAAASAEEANRSNAMMQEFVAPERMLWIELDELIQRAGPSDHNERMAVMSAPFAADVPPTSDPAWRFFYSSPVFGRPELAQILDACGATSDERALAKALYDDYRARLDAVAAELGAAVAVLLVKQEEFNRKNPDAKQGDDFMAYIVEYAELDARWAREMANANVELWAALRPLIGESRRRAFDRALFDVRWHRTGRIITNWGGSEQHPSHMLAVVEDAFSAGVPAGDASNVIASYSANLRDVMFEIERELQSVNLEMQAARRKFADDPEKANEAAGEAPNRGSELARKHLDVDQRYRKEFFASLSQADQAVFKSALEREENPGLFIASPIDLLARELETAAIDADRMTMVNETLDRARAAYDANTRVIIDAKAYWADPNRKNELEKWWADHPPPDPARPQFDREGPMDRLWYQRRDIAKDACNSVRRVFNGPDFDQLAASVRMILWWAEEKG